MRIGNIEIENPTALAPMAGICNEAYREICKEKGAGLIYAEMVSIEGIAHGNAKSLSMTKVTPYEHPIALQIFGSNLKSFMKAAKYVDEETDADIIDINMGCPVPKVATRAQAGAALLRDPQKVFDIISSITSTVKKPVTIKIRLGWDDNSINCVEIAKIAERAGCKAIAIHARTRCAMYSGKANWSWIKKVKEAVNIPVIGNGDVFSGADAKRMIDETGCDGVMIARGAIGNPWIFREVNSYLKNEKYNKPLLEEKISTCLLHARKLMKLKGEGVAIKEMRGLASHYVTGEKNAVEFRRKLITITCYNDLELLATEFLKNQEVTNE